MVLKGANGYRYEFLLLRYYECSELEGIWFSPGTHIRTVTSRTKETLWPDVQIRKIAC